MRMCLEISIKLQFRQWPIMCVHWLFECSAHIALAFPCYCWYLVMVWCVVDYTVHHHHHHSAEDARRPPCQCTDTSLQLAIQKVAEHVS